MDFRELGQTGIKVSSCCLGTMTWGEQNTEAEGHEQMDYAVERGINFFDTAEMYAVPPKPETQGSTERIIGSWFKARGNRDRIVLASKVIGRTTNTWARDGNPEAAVLDKKNIDEAVEKSLQRLQTDYIDLYQLHWPDRAVPLFGEKVRPQDYLREFTAFAETLEALDAHVKKGNIRYVGLSNETPYGLMKFLSEAEKLGLPRMQSVQNAYNLVNRTYEDGLEEISLREQVSCLPYSPLAQGYLTGKYRGGALPEGSRKKLFGRLQRYEKSHAEAAINSYLDRAEARGIDPTQLAIRFCDTRAFVTSTIIGATSMEQLKTCIDAFDLPWTHELETEIEALHAAQPNPCP